MVLYPIRYEDSSDLIGQEDMFVLLSAPQQRLLQSILNNVESNPAIFIQDYFDVATTDEIDKFLADTMNRLMGGEPVVSQWLQNKVNLFPYNVDSIVGTLTWFSDTLQAINSGYWQLSNVINNVLQWNDVALKKGGYYARIYGVRASTFGIASIYVNGSLVTTLDMYNSTTQRNYIQQGNPFTISADGYHDISIYMLSKNGSSTGYFLDINYLELYRYQD